MWPFKKGKKKEDSEDLDPDTVGASLEEEEEKPEEPASEPTVAAPSGGGADSVTIIKMGAEVEKLKAQFSTFYELQKATNERFSRIGEQMGELRTMMIERDKDSQRLDAKATQAVDLVKAVQPDKFMVDLRRMDSKVEALKANLESTENILKSTINELKAMRDKMAVFSGMEQVLKINDEVKSELMGIRKIQSTVERHSDKVETLFSEMQKRTKEFVRFHDIVQDLEKGFKQVSTDFDSVKIKITDFSTKKEVENLIAKFDDFEKYVGSIVSLLNSKFSKLEEGFSKEFSERIEEVEKLLNGFKLLAQKTPDLDKYFNLLTEEEKKATEEKKEKETKQVEKLKIPGQEEKIKVEQKETVKEKLTEAVSTVKDKVTEKLKK